MEPKAYALCIGGPAHGNVWKKSKNSPSRVRVPCGIGPFEERPHAQFIYRTKNGCVDYLFVEHATPSGETVLLLVLEGLTAESISTFLSDLYIVDALAELKKLEATNAPT